MIERNQVSARQSGLQDQFKSLEQQHEASVQGIWVFIATEILFFGGMFLAYVVYRRAYATDFTRMSREFSCLFGTMNTAVLLTSSLTMALAVRAAQLGKTKALTGFLSLTLALGLTFLTIKGFEYAKDFQNHLVFGRSFPFQGTQGSHMRILLFLYYVMTGVHGLHLFIGIGLIAVMIRKTQQNVFTPEYHSPIEVTGLYWHFVDIIWIFLYPLLYLIGKPIL
jgi:cytochrome c oxidase subunit 3